MFNADRTASPFVGPRKKAISVCLSLASSTTSLSPPLLLLLLLLPGLLPIYSRCSIMQRYKQHIPDLPQQVEEKVCQA
jgi:hypothetical protein